MKKIPFWGISIIIGTAVYAQDKDLQIVSIIISKQESAWNNANLEGFMDGYWHSDSLIFIGKSGVKRGWQQTLDNYKKNYPNAEAMGKLAFTLLHIYKLSDTGIYVIGKWALSRKEGNISGHFTLLWKKINGNWVIIADHSS